MHWFELSALWYVQTLVFTIAAAPLLWWLFRGLPDSGASVVRPFSLLVLIWPVWFLGSIGVPFTTVTIWIALLLIGAAGWILLIRGNLFSREAAMHLALAEVGFLACFALYLAFHGYGPDLTSQEKSSDLMMLASSMRATEMPPNDAWLSGNTINYYYLGYVLLGSIGRLIGAMPAETFNLALATVFASTIMATVGLTANIVNRWKPLTTARAAGAIGAGLLALGGNPWSAFTWLGDPSLHWNRWFFGRASDGEFAIGWHASRILDDHSTISEFPSFSFVLADLHPHLIALPFAILALTVAWLLLCRPEPGNWVRLIAAGGIIGSLYTLNSWDYPTYLLVGVLALFWGTMGRSAQDRLFAIGTLVVSSVVVWAPFYVNFEAPTRQNDSALADALASIPIVGGPLASIAAWNGDRSTFGEYLSIFGFFWVIAVVLIAVEAIHRRSYLADPSLEKLLGVVAAFLILTGILLPAPVLIVAGVPVIAVLWLLSRDHSVSLANVSLGLFGFGFALSCVPDFFFLLDVFGNRMNTVFKLYYQVWVLLGIGSAVGLVAVTHALRKWWSAQVAVAIGTAIILALGGVYPVVAGHQWLEWRNPQREWVGLDGLEYLEQSDPAEYAALEWLWNNATEDDVILASPGNCAYHDALGRPGSATGVPVVLGWVNHERQWHLGSESFYADFAARGNDITTMYSTLNPQLMTSYGITLMFVGRVETDGYVSGSCVIEPMPNVTDPSWPGQGWVEVFNLDGIRIYEREGSR